MAIEVTPPFKEFTDLSGAPLDNGYIYIGTENLNPEVNLISIYWDETFTTPAANPVRTIAGYPSRNGSPSRIFAKSAFSITVKDKNSQLVYSSLSSNNIVQSTTVGTIASLRTTVYSSQSFISVTGYYTAQDNIGVREYYWDATSTDADNGGTIIQVTGITTGRWKMKYSGAINVMWFGAKGDWDGATGTDNSTYFSAAVSFLKQGAESYGDTLYIPTGEYKISDTIDLSRDLLNNHKINIKGDGETATRLWFIGANKSCIKISGTSSSPQSYQKIEGISILGNGSISGQIGISLAGAPFVSIENTRCEGLEYGLYCRNVDHSRFNNMMIRFNTNGAYFYKDILNTVNTTQANNIQFNGCVFGSNSGYGAYIHGGSLVSFNGCSVENNGTYPTGWGIKYDECGYEGGIGASCNEVYFESNRGVGDVVIVNTDASLIPACTHNIINCSFNRASTNFTVNSIYVNFADPSVNGMHILNVIGSSFKSYNDYVPDAGRKYIAFYGIAMNPNNYNTVGCLFEDSVETPFYQNNNPLYIVSTKSGTQIIPTGVYTKWLLDTNLYNYGFGTQSLATNDITIREAGLYRISATISYSDASVTGGIIRIRKSGTTTLASNTMSGATSASISADKFLAINDVISLEVIHSSGADRTLIGTSSGSVSLNIIKISN